MFCGNCGKNIEDNAKFCPYCGLDVHGAERPPEGTTITFSSKAKDIKTVLILLPGVLLIGLAGVLFLTGTISLGLSNGDDGQIFDYTEDGQAVLVPDDADTGQPAPVTAETLLERGKMFADRKDYETAVAAFSEAIIMDPNMAEAYRWRGRALFLGANQAVGNGAFAEQTHAYDRAITDLTQAIRLDPDNVEAYFYRGGAYFPKEDYNKGIADFTQAIRLDPDYAKAYYARGLVYAIKEEYGRAIADLETVLKLEPDNDDAKEYLEKARRSRGY
jgi:tetratricopeptide (TPR) repeat protein